MAVLLAVALWLEWRTRIALAGATALALVAVMRSPRLTAWRGVAPLPWLGQISYSVFLVHFPVCLLVNAVVDHLWPGSVPASLLGLVGAFALSVAVGQQLYERVERRMPNWQVALRWQAGLVGAGLVTAWLS